MSVKREIEQIRRGVMQVQAARLQAARGFRAPVIYTPGQGNEQQPGPDGEPVLVWPDDFDRRHRGMVCLPAVREDTE
jgi:hypothetical protein